MLRKAEEADVPRIRELMRSVPGFWSSDWRHNALELALGSSTVLAYVWENESQILGFVCAHDLGFRAYLNELVVAEPCRMNGIGRSLVERVTSELNSRGCRVVISDVWKDAQGFYESMGWTKPDVVLLRKLTAE
jgi:N-acetylglutamate synthase-like GNAT family acetyltransferase